MAARVVAVPAVPEEQQGDGFPQSLHRDGLLQERFALPERRFLVKEPVAVAGEIQHFDVGLALAKLPCEFIAVHLRHDEIDHERIEGPLLLDRPEDFESV